MTVQRLMFLPAAFALAMLAVPSTARAQFGTPCTSCESCTTALSAPDARVDLANELTAGAGGACITIKGANATLNGKEFTIRGGQTAVRIEGDRVSVRNVHVDGAQVGIDVVKAREVTLYHNSIKALDAAVHAEQTRDLRVLWSYVQSSGNAGFAFGRGDEGGCATGQKLENNGVVLLHNYVENTRVGLLACDAVPVVAYSTFVRNQVGMVLGAPSAGPASDGPGASTAYDSCACAPSLDNVKVGTTLLYSSGCGGCITHEGWLPDVRGKGHDVRVRETKPDQAAATLRYDTYIARCAPEIPDAIGVPGCMPNYACMTNASVFKRRGPAGLYFDAELNSSDDVSAYAAACEKAADDYFTKSPSCVRAAMHDNVVCANQKLDVRASSKTIGLNNACGTGEGWKDEKSEGCTQKCPSTLPDAPVVPDSAALAAAAAAANAPAHPPSTEPAPSNNAPAVGPPAPSNNAPAAGPPAPSNNAPVNEPARKPAETAPTKSEESSGSAVRWMVGLGALAALVFVTRRIMK